MALLNPDGRLLGLDHAILSGTGTRHHVRDFEGPLSIKAVVRGRAVWETDDGRFDIDASHVVALNERRRYSMTIESRAPAETLVACFRNGFVNDVARVRCDAPARLLDDPERSIAVTFVETLQPDARSLRRTMLHIRSALRGAADTVDAESLFARLAEILLDVERDALGRSCRVPAAKAATRVELLRRANRARDFIEAELASEPTLPRIARAACLSPYHCHRVFCAVFGETPHAYVTRRRLERARALLAAGGTSVLEACLAVGFSSVGSFGTRYRAAFGVTPGADRDAGRGRHTSAVGVR